jgi:hypothetical protein
LTFAHALADRLDNAGPFEADAAGQGQRVEAGPVIGVDEIEADRRMADRRLPGSRGRNIDSFPAQDFGTTGW